jgi:hypothetical protein
MRGVQFSQGSRRSGGLSTYETRMGLPDHPGAPGGTIIAIGTPRFRGSGSPRVENRANLEAKADGGADLERGKGARTST